MVYLACLVYGSLDGPIVGGLLIKANVFGWDWRPIFLMQRPVGIFGLLAGMKYLPNGKSPHRSKLDITGTAILVGALSLLVFPLIEVATWAGHYGRS